MTARRVCARLCAFFPRAHWAMVAYRGVSGYQHGSASRTGILLANLGTPDDPHPPAVRRFLAEFLWDPRVIEQPRWLWWLILHGVILRARPAKSSHAYRQIWTNEGSPLLVHSRAVTAALRAKFSGPAPLRVALGMSYGSPSIPTALRELQSAGVERLLVLPLYPQYSATTTASVFDRVTRELQGWRWIPELRFINSYHDEPAYIEALANSIAEHWRVQARNHLLFSFHGIPRRYLLAGDPYHCQCQKTARLVAARLQLAESEWSVSFQSQVGREEWLRPYTDETLLRYAREGRRQVTVISPGFATDCLETLEEIDLRNREAFLSAGGESYSYVPALNATAAHVNVLAGLIERHTQGWPRGDHGADMLARERALRMGAAR